MIGALLHYISHAEPRDFQPMKANFGLLPPLEKRVRRKPGPLTGPTPAGRWPICRLSSSF